MKLDENYDHYDYPTTSLNAANGHPGHTTQEQEAALSKMRAELAQAGYTERLDTLSLVRGPVMNRELELILLAAISACTKVQCWSSQTHVCLLEPDHGIRL